MTGHRPLPSEDTVRAALDQLRTEADTTGRSVSVLALARRVGLPNTTLRRQFPAVCAELAAARSTTVDLPEVTSAYARLVRDNAKLRQDNKNLAEHLELAIANIQRLALDNHQLRQELEAAHNLSRLRPGSGRHDRDRTAR